MTIDDSTLVAQAFSSTSKNLRRFIHTQLNRDRVYKGFVVYNAALLVLRGTGFVKSSANGAEQLVNGVPSLEYILNRPILTFLTYTVLLPALVSFSTSKPERKSFQDHIARPELPGIVVSSLIPLLTSGSLGFGGEGDAILSHVGILACWALMDQGMNIGSTVVGASIVALRPHNLPWIILSYISSNAQNHKSSYPIAAKSKTIEDKEVSSRQTQGGTAGLLLPCAATFASAAISSRFVNTRILANQMFSHSDAHSVPVQTQFLLGSLLLLPSLLSGGLLETLQGALKVQLGSLSGLLRAGGFAMALTSFMRASQGNFVLNLLSTFSTVVFFWIWIYRLGGSLRANTHFAFLLIAYTITYLDSTTAIDIAPLLILLRMALATSPLSTRSPASKLEEEKRKPDPQKGLTDSEENGVDLGLEVLWYLLIRISVVVRTGRL